MTLTFENEQDFDLGFDPEEVAAAVMAAVPIPASLVKSPLAIPKRAVSIREEPAAPPKAALGARACFMIRIMAGSRAERLIQRSRIQLKV